MSTRLLFLAYIWFAISLVVLLVAASAIALNFQPISRPTRILTLVALLAGGLRLRYGSPRRSAAWLAVVLRGAILKVHLI